jgi:hypothetical protein
MPITALPELTLSNSAMAVLEAAEAAGRLSVVGSVEELVAAAVPADQMDAAGEYVVGYDVAGRGFVPEVRVARVRNGISANYLEPYMRRRDPDCMVIGDERPTNKPTYTERFGRDLREDPRGDLRLARHPAPRVFPFTAGGGAEGLPALAVAPANAGFFALGLAMLQGINSKDEAGEGFTPGAIIYTAPPFRHTHFEGKQVVVHDRSEGLHELFSYNLYPGPSAKKGIYGVLLNVGESQGWTTAHCSTVRVRTPYDNDVVFMHEGASGGGKSEMLEHIHREADGRLVLGENTITGEKRHLTLPAGATSSPSPTTWPSAPRASRRASRADASSPSPTPRTPGSSASTTSPSTASTPTSKNSRSTRACLCSS